MTKDVRLCDRRVVKGSTESMEEVTRVSHFEGSPGKESEGEKGERDGGKGRSGHQESGSCCQPAADQKDDLQLKSRPLALSAIKAGETDTVTVHEWRLKEDNHQIL